jgi:GT2 family glycosyltransferase
MRTPILVAELELTEPINDVRLPARDDGVPYNGARLLVRLQRRPIGYVLLSPDALDAASVARKIWLRLSDEINALRLRHGLKAIDTLPVEGLATEERLAEEVTEHPLVSIVLNTRDRPESVVGTLRGLLALRYQPFEIVLVDNAPSTDMTKDAVLAEFGDDPRVRYVREPRQGTSFAKNRGIAVARGDIIAFTDDDVRVDQWWLDALVRGFERADGVACVTGLLATGALENEVQLYRDKRGDHGLLREGRVFDLADNREDCALYPFSAGVFGAGANFAMTRSALDELGGFDEALGAGAPCGGGEDNHMFMRTVLAGHRLVHEPSAIVWHFGHADLAALSRGMATWGSGTTAALTALVLRDRRVGLKLLRIVPAGVKGLSSMGSRTKDDLTLPSGMNGRQLRGMVRGPWLYLKARRDNRRLTDQPALVPTRTPVHPG